MPGLARPAAAPQQAWPRATPLRLAFHVCTGAGRTPGPRRPQREDERSLFSLFVYAAGPEHVPGPSGPHAPAPPVESAGAERAWIRVAQRGSVADLERLFREHGPRGATAARPPRHRRRLRWPRHAQEAFLAAIRNLDLSTAAAPFGPLLPDRRQTVDRLTARPEAGAPRSSRRLLARAPRPNDDGAPPARGSATPPDHRAVLGLRYFSTTRREIAQLLDLPRRTCQLAPAPRLDHLKELQ